MCEEASTVSGPLIGRAASTTGVGLTSDEYAY